MRAFIKIPTWLNSDDFHNFCILLHWSKVSIRSVKFNIISMLGEETVGTSIYYRLTTNHWQISYIPKPIFKPRQWLETASIKWQCLRPHGRQVRAKLNSKYKWESSELSHVGIHMKALIEDYHMSTNMPGFQSLPSFLSSFHSDQVRVNNMQYPITLYLFVYCRFAQQVSRPCLYREYSTLQE